MYDCLTKPIDWFRQFGDVLETADGPLIHRDNGSNVLAVAHLDYVMTSKPTQKGNRIYCPQLDDRLGAWIVLNSGCDVLLTDSEEIGRSTARFFKPTKDYNWMFSFDRRGRDVAMYDYETQDNCDLLEWYGFQVGSGSFSDICSLSHLGIVGFNFGTGYYNEHSKGCYANLDHTQEMLELFRVFHKDMQGVPLPVREDLYEDYFEDDMSEMDTSWIAEEDDIYNPWKSYR